MTIRFMICRIGVPAPYVCGAYGGTGLNRTQLGAKFGV